MKDYTLGILSFLFIMVGSFILRENVEVSLSVFSGLVGILTGGYLAALSTNENHSNVK